MEPKKIKSVTVSIVPPSIGHEVMGPDARIFIASWLSEEALQIAEKIREVKGKGKKETYAHLKAEFQRVARRNKKAFLSDQCKETKENNRMGKTRDLFKKIKDTKGTFHAKMGTIRQ